MTYYAHTREGKDGKTEHQTVEEHLTGTAVLCREFAASFGAAEQGELAGLTHDIGKCTEAFQRRLLENGPIADHATAGAIICAKRGQLCTAACVAGHHGGLPDFGNAAADRAGESTLYGRLKKGIEGRYPEQCGESGISLPTQIPAMPVRGKLAASFWTRMLYSCLVDADYLDTERFMSRGQVCRWKGEEITVLAERLRAYTAPWQSPQTDLNRLRCEILRACAEAGDKPRGIYTLTVPTGGGKTVASLAFALRHAAAHGMKRVIYVIPYTSIIEQNAKVFRDILGDENVLERHSGVWFELADGAPPQEIRKALAAENWEIPVVVTTAVQLFESMYAARSSQCRKLHNLADSVVIFDEAQMLPLPHLRPCTAAMGALAEQFRATVVLCIVNSRRAAQSIFSKLPREGSFHLSTLMIPAQRQQLLEEIHRRLKDGEPCRVISTSLIEAGVDVDFPTVYRELAGLDSVLQAAGRCNREGLRPADDSIVTIFERMELPPVLFRTAIGAAKEALEGGRAPAAPETMTRYFRALRSLTGEALDKQGVVKAFTDGIEGCEFPFETVARQFRLIGRETRTVYIPYGEGEELLRRLRAGEGGKELYRRLGRYAVPVYEQHFEALYRAGALLTAAEEPVLDENSAILTDRTLYSETMGLTLEPENGKAEFV